MSKTTPNEADLSHIIEDAKKLGAETNLSTEDRMENRKLAVNELAQNLISTRLNVTQQSEDLRGKLVKRILDNIESLPLDYCIQLLPIIESSSNNDLNRLVALSGIHSQGKGKGGGGALNIFLGGEQVVEGGQSASSAVSGADSKALVKMNSLYDAINLVSEVAKQQREEAAELVDPHEPEPSDPVEAAEQIKDISGRVI